MGGIHRRLPGKAWLKRVSLSLCLTSPMTRFSGHLELSFFSWYRETSLPVDISLINVNFPYKKVTPTLFSQVLCVQFLKIILSANRQILRWHILVPRIPTFETYLRSFKVPELSQDVAPCLNEPVLVLRIGQFSLRVVSYFRRWCCR